MKTIGERLAKAMNSRGYTKNKLAVEAGIHPSTIKNYIENIGTPDNLKLEKVSNILQINFEWLRSGFGPMIEENEVELIETNVNEPQELYSNKNGNVYYEKNGKLYVSVKLVPVKAFGSYLSEFQDPDFFDSLPETREFKVDHMGRGNYICFEVKGDSMNGGKIDDSKDGAELLCRELGRHLWKGGFKENALGWVIVHKDTIVFKDIKSVNMETGDMVLSSRSGLPQHPDFTVNLNDVCQIWKVIKRTQD